MATSSSTVTGTTDVPISLHYFTCQARGETARVLLADAGVAYTEVPMTLADWPACKSGTLSLSRIV
jgi:hypothetical protein